MFQPSSTAPGPTLLFFLVTLLYLSTVSIHMSTRSIYLIVDNTSLIRRKGDSALSLVSFFVYNYLINPIVFNKSSKVSLIKVPEGGLDVDHKPLTWEGLTQFVASLDGPDKPSTDDNPQDLIQIITDILQSVSYGVSKVKSCDVIVVSPFDTQYDWKKHGSKIKSVLELHDNINLIFVDSYATPSTGLGDGKIHDENISFINNTIVNSNMKNEQNFTYTLTDAISALTKFSLFTPKFKRPVEIYSYKLQILGIPDLEFDISAYPFVKRSTMTDYVTSTSIDKKSHQRIKEKYVYYYEEESKEKENFGEKEIREIQNPEFIIEGYKFGTSNFLLTDLPTDVFNLNSLKSMTITSFVPKSTIPPWYLHQDSLIVLPSSRSVKNGSKTINKDMSIYSELWYAMVRLNVVAMVRYVKRNGTDVKYGILYPQGFVDEQSEITGVIDFGCFMFVETIFKDDEKLVNLPDLLNLKIKDPKLEKDMDALVDSFCLDKEDDSKSDDGDGDDLPTIESTVVSMNGVPNNDIFYGLREEILEEAGLSLEEQTDSPLLAKTITAKLRKYNNPLMSVSKLIYLISYFIFEQHVQEDGSEPASLYSMYNKHGIPMQVIERWLDMAKKDGIFRPTALNKQYK